MKFFNKKSIQIKIISFLLLNAFVFSNTCIAFESKSGNDIDKNCLAPLLHIDNNMIVNVFVEYNRDIVNLLEILSKAPRLQVGNDNVIGVAKQRGSEYFLLLSHQGSAMSADINFSPDDRNQKGLGLGVFSPEQDEHIYEIVEIYDNTKSDIDLMVNPERMLVTGRSLRIFGLGFHNPLPASSTKIYKFKEISTQIPNPDNGDYNTLLRHSLLNYKRFAPQDRLEHSFIAREITKALDAGNKEFSGLFHALSKMIEENESIDINQLCRIFSDIVFYGDQQLKDNAQKFLIDIAITEQIKEMEYAVSVHGVKKDRTAIINARSSENAIKLLRSATVGEIVLTSPESLWSTGTGGMALYVSDLAKELAALGIPVTVIVPLFSENIRKTEIFETYGLHNSGRAIHVKFGRNGDETAVAKIYEAHDQGVRLLYLENEPYFGLLKGEDGGDNAYNGLPSFRMRFARMLSLGTLLTIREMNIHPSVIQTNDWTTAYLKAYLEGRERIETDLEGLRFDPHLQSTKVLSILHNSHAYYQGIMWTPDLAQRDQYMLDDLGFNPEKDSDIIIMGHDHTQHDIDDTLRARAWVDINPAYTAIRTADHVRDVSKGHHDRSLDLNYGMEFGYLSGVLGWKDSIGGYDGAANGFGLAQRQRDFLRKMLIGPQESNTFMKDVLDRSIKENTRLIPNPEYAKWLSSPESLLRAFYGINSEQESEWMQKLLIELKPDDKTMPVFKTEVKKLLETELLVKTTAFLRSNMQDALDDKEYAADDPEYRATLQQFLDQPEKMIKSFFDIGHESERGRYARLFFDFIKPLQKSILQDVLGLEKDANKFTYSMLHRVGEQKGHQLLTVEIWNRHKPGLLKAIKGTKLSDKIESHDYEINLSQEDQEKLLDFANKHNIFNLRAMEVAMILNPEMQFAIVGSSDGDFDRAFQDTFNMFKSTKQFAYLPEFISINSALYDLIYSGSDRFGMPSWYEPGGLSNQEAAGYGTPRHLTRRDGLLDGEIQVEGLRESFEEFNPVAWMVSLQKHSKFFKENKQQEEEMRYKAITQDNRWVNRARNYVELYRKLAGAEKIPELESLEMAAAIHQAAILGDKDPADELMRSGYKSEQALDNLLNVVLTSKNDVLVSALIEKHIPYLSKIKEIKPVLMQRIETVFLDQSEELLDSEIYVRFETLKSNINKLDKKTSKTILPDAYKELAALQRVQKKLLLKFKLPFIDQAI